MGSEPLLRLDSSELIFPFEPNKQLSSSIRLSSNDTRNHVAFKILTTNPKKYGVRPRIGILSRGSSWDVTVTTRAPNNMSCKDKFMIQSIVISPGATLEDARAIFNRTLPRRDFEEQKLQVVFRNPTESTSSEPPVSEDLDINVQQRHTDILLDVRPPEIQIPFELKKEISRLLQLTNITEIPVVFVVKTSCSRYQVEPSIGVISPKSTTVVKVKMKLKIELPSIWQSKDKLLIRSIAANTSMNTEDIILDMFDKAGSAIQEYQVQIDYTNTGELILKGIAFLLLTIACWYLMRQTLSLLWSLVMIVVMLIIKMAKKLVSDSVEDWIVKTLLYVFMHILFGRKANNIDM